MNKEDTNYIGFGLILGVAIGFSFGLIINSMNSPIFAGIGIISGSIIKYKKN